jgi:hypothetical protein
MDTLDADKTSTEQLGLLMAGVHPVESSKN